MANEAEHTNVGWEGLPDYDMGILPDDHPWPKRENLQLRVYSKPLRCEHMAFSIGRVGPGESVSHHRHKESEEIYVLMQGRAQIRIGDEVFEAKQFDAYRVPAHIYRSVYNHSDEECWWMFMGAPIDEYLENEDYKPDEA